jgi:hypothetical protein
MSIGLRSANAQRIFLDQLSVNQAPSLPMLVHGFGFLDTHTFLQNERIAAIRSPLLVERDNTPAAAICNDVANHSGSKGRALPPLSPPDIGQSGKGWCFGNRSGPSAGSYEMNLIGAGTFWGIFRPTPDSRSRATSSSMVLWHTQQIRIARRKERLQILLDVVQRANTV